MCGSVQQSSGDLVRALVESASCLIDDMRAGGTDHYYRVYPVRKRRKGGYRLISAPAKALKIVQRKLADAFDLPTHCCATGFIKGKSILHNAYKHCTATNLLNVDFADFFQSVDEDMLRSVFASSGWSDISDDLLLLVTKNGVLPAGAPTSPCLSNAVCRPFDNAVNLFSQEHNLAYSRYVDDITISSHGYIHHSVLEHLRECARENRFRLNESKTRFCSRRRNLMITGLVINHDPRVYGYAPRISRSVMRRIRAIIHQDAVGRQSHSEAVDISRALSVDPDVAGYLAWAKGINPSQANRIVGWMRAKS